jgi:predicted metalloendopeptidase
MKNPATAVLAATLATLIAAPLAVAAPAPGHYGLSSGLAQPATKPGDDFDRYVNGPWRDAYELADYQSQYSTFVRRHDEAEADVRAIIEELAQRTDLAPGSDEQKIRDAWASYMDQDARDARGIAPLRPVLDAIAAIDSPAALAAAFGRGEVEDTHPPIFVDSSVDPEHPGRYGIVVGVGGLGLPGRDYYVSSDARAVRMRVEYLAHIERMLGFAGVDGDETHARAQAVLALETALAEPERQYQEHAIAAADWDRTYPGVDWNALFAAAGMPRGPTLTPMTPEALASVARTVAATPLATWRDYLRFHAVADNAGLLSREIEDARFAFTARLSGVTGQKPAWKRALDALYGPDGLGEAVARRYIARHFPPAAKQQMEALVEQLRTVLRRNLARADWMDAATRATAAHKLDTLRAKIGYPDRWRDYAPVDIRRDDVVANALALRRLDQSERHARVGTAVDRDEWGLLPQTVNVYYDPTRNEIVFPAAMLQPPFFDLHADAATNYGAIGAVIGHQMFVAFDEQGSRFDADGAQHDWWTAADRARFRQRIAPLRAQYAAFCPLADACVDGARTLAENTGDLAGLALAYEAYHASLDGRPAPVRDGLTGDQRFFLAWAQVWRAKYRDDALRGKLRSDPHAPAMSRINGPVRNLDAWYDAFGVQPGDALYLAPEQRVRLW